MSGIKNDQNKPHLDLIPEELMVEIAKVLEFGAKKYAKNNWREGFEYSRPTAAALRHIYVWNSGRDNDEETGLSHLAHAITSLMFNLVNHQHGVGVDDRYVFRQNKKNDNRLPVRKNKRGASAPKDS